MLFVICDSAGKYVKVVGTVREHQGRRNVVALNIEAIDDFNVVTHHFLNTIYIHATKLSSKNSAFSSSSDTLVQRAAPRGDNLLSIEPNNVRTTEAIFSCWS